MKYRTLINYTEEQKALMWDRCRILCSKAYARIFCRPSYESLYQYRGNFLTSWQSPVAPKKYVGHKNIWRSKNIFLTSYAIHIN